MDDLIYRGSVKVLVSDTWWDEIDSIPAVDAVEVVRCKDCRWFVCEKGELQESYKIKGCYRLRELGKIDPMLTSGNGFCSWGMRREEAHNAAD